MPTTRRTATGSTPWPYNSVPSSCTLPLTCAPGITSCMRFSVRSRVDFPQPDGPMKAVTGTRLYGHRHAFDRMEAAIEDVEVLHIYSLGHDSFLLQLGGASD